MNLEMLSYESIKKKLQKPGTVHNPNDIVKCMQDNEDVLFQWAVLSVDISHREDSLKLLHDIIALWLKMRGHSYASALTETYKQITGAQVKRAKALRKRLQFESGEYNIYVLACMCISYLVLHSWH